MQGELWVARGRLVLDDACVWSTTGDRIALSSIEVALLRFFLAHEGQVLGRNRLLTEVWHYSPQVFSRAADSAIKRLRKKIDPDTPPQNLLTVFGAGYRFLRSASPTSSLLPPAAGPLFGREAMILEVLEALVIGDVTLAGPGGIGKTRLALEVAYRHPGPVCWSADGDALAPEAALWVVDGADPTPFVARGVRVLCIAAGPRIGRCFAIPPLDAVASEALFEHTAGQSGTGVMGPLDGNPLAIELAARRLRTMSIGQLREHLIDPFRVLVGGGRSLQSTLQRTWNATPVALREAWSRLSVLGDPFTEGMAQDLTDCERSTLESLEARGLLLRVGQEWRMPTGPRVYAMESHPAPAAVSERVFGWAVAQAQASSWTPTALVRALPTLRAAWRQDAPSSSLARVLAGYVRRTEGAEVALGMLDAVESTIAVEVERAACLVELGRGQRALEVLDAASGGAPPDVSVMRQVWRARVAQVLQRPELRLEAGNAAIDVEGAGPHVRSTALNQLAQFWFDQEEIDRGMVLNRRARELVGADADATILDVTLGSALWRAGRVDDAEALARGAVETGRQGDLVALAAALLLRCDPGPHRADTLEQTWWELRGVHNRAVVACTLVPYRIGHRQFDAGMRVARAMLASTLLPTPDAHLRGWLAVGLAATGQTALARSMARQIGKVEPEFADCLQRCLGPWDEDSVGELRTLTWIL